MSRLSLHESMVSCEHGEGYSLFVENVSLHGWLAMGSMESKPSMGMNMTLCLEMIMNLGRELHGEHDIALSREFALPK